MADAIDDDTLAAVVALWGTNQALAKLFPAGLQAGRLHSPKDAPLPIPNAQVACEFAREDLAYSYRLDRRKVTLTMRGVKADVVAGLKAALATFSRDMGNPVIPQTPGLTYPSGARFVRWWPLDSGKLEQEEATRQGQDVWRGIITGEATSARTS